MNETSSRNGTESAAPAAPSAGTARTAAGARKLWAVFTIIETHDSSRGVWRRIGNAFPNKDGSFRLLLDALPVNGTLHMREAEPETAAHGERV